MDVIVVGAGIGGLALARGLIADGHRVRVLESAPEPRTGGAAVTIYSNGAAALAGLGVPLPEGLGGRIERLDVRNSAGAVTFQVDMRVMSARTGYPVTTVPREQLLAHLAGGLPDGVVGYDRTVEKATPDGSVIDQHGEIHRADVVVGADGYRSAVRRSTIGGVATSVGWTSWQGLTAVLPEVAAGVTGLLLVGDAGLVGLMPAGDGLLQWWFDVEGELGGASPVDELRRRFGRYAPPVPALLDLISDRDLGRFPHVLHDIPDVWGSGATTLLGDAAHVFPPSQAQGANQALEDAWLLRRALFERRDTIARLRSYERLRAVRARRVATMAASESTNRPPGALTRFAVRLIPASMTARAYTSLIRRFSSVLADERIG